ncbi:hypothetical protein NW766_007257 [Fusarium irregulare]|uniref:Uncharacterized protein n=1 Tax=Fusarium irregulare TaxID=2494466 RepID=A0A9W8PNR9_9HYPO|nr:hypothetical protein NW766_007257 [Fusarium irregulare]
MPDFRRLFTLLKILTCDCFSPSDPDSPKKQPANARPLLGEVNYVNYRSRPEYSHTRDVNRISKPIEVDEPVTVSTDDANGASKPKHKGKGKTDD